MKMCERYLAEYGRMSDIKIRTGNEMEKRDEFLV